MSWSHFTVVCFSWVCNFCGQKAAEGEENQDNISLHLFCFLYLGFLSFLFNRWGEEKWSFLLHFQKLVNPSSITNERHLLSEEFVLPVTLSWGGLELVCRILQSQFLPYSELGESVLKSSRSWFPVLSYDLCANQCSLPNKAMFVYHYKCKHHTSGTPCFKVYSLWGHLVYHNKQDPFQSRCLTMLKLILATCCFHKSTV